MSDKIRVLIVDDLPETRENVRKLLQFEPDLDVIGQASNGEQAIEMAKEKQPDIVLMDINMPGVDGISASQAISQAVPRAQTIIMSVQSESDYLRRAMLAGARDFLMKPFSGDEIATAIRRVYETRPALPVAPTGARTGGAAAVAEAAEQKVQVGEMVAVFSPKGGNGCTTVAVNLAVTLARKGYDTILVDLSLQFGDVAVMLNLKEVTSIVDLIDRITELDQDLVGSVLLSHESGLRILAAPPRPEMAELVTVEHVQTLLDNLRHSFEFVVIDTSSNLNDLTLSVLDAVDRILLVTQQSLPSLKNASRFFDLTDELDYPSDKIRLVVNRSSPKTGVPIKAISDTLKRPVVANIPIDDAAGAAAADQGTPLVIGAGSRRPVGAALIKLTEQLLEDLENRPEAEKEEKERGSRLSRLFGGR